MQVDTYMESDLMQSLKIYRDSSQDGNKTIKDDFDAVQHLVSNQKVSHFLFYYYLICNGTLIMIFQVSCLSLHH